MKTQLKNEFIDLIAKGRKAHDDLAALFAEAEKHRDEALDYDRKYDVKGLRKAVNDATSYLFKQSDLMHHFKSAHDDIKALTPELYDLYKEEEEVRKGVIDPAWRKLCDLYYRVDDTKMLLHIIIEVSDGKKAKSLRKRFRNGEYDLWREVYDHYNCWYKRLSVDDRIKANNLESRW